MSDVPTAIELDLGANALSITWADGARSLYDGPTLRRLCPCAECRGHVPGSVPPIPAERVRDVRVTHVEGVGAYAVRFQFSDGHATGIYSFDWLRAEGPVDGPLNRGNEAP